jgi:hypothetical protein
MRVVIVVGEFGPSGILQCSEECGFAASKYHDALFFPKIISARSDDAIRAKW